jgi:hypothetical protein
LAQLNTYRVGLLFLNYLSDLLRTFPGDMGGSYQNYLFVIIIEPVHCLGVVGGGHELSFSFIF